MYDILSSGVVVDDGYSQVQTIKTLKKAPKIEDLSDVILTKKDCDMIANALAKTYEFKDIKDLYYYFIKLGQIK